MPFSIYVDTRKAVTEKKSLALVLLVQYSKHITTSMYKGCSYIHLILSDSFPFVAFATFPIIIIICHLRCDALIERRTDVERK